MWIDAIPMILGGLVIFFLGTWFGWARAPKEIERVEVREDVIIQSPNGPTLGIQDGDVLHPIFDADVLSRFVAHCVTQHGIYGRPAAVQRLLAVFKTEARGWYEYEIIDAQGKKEKRQFGWNSARPTPIVIASLLPEDAEGYLLE